MKFTDSIGNELSGPRVEAAKKFAMISLHSSIQIIQAELTRVLFKLGETEHHNFEYLKIGTQKRYKREVERYCMVLSDLVTIKNAIKDGKEAVIIYGCAGQPRNVYSETKEALQKAHIILGEMNAENGTRKISGFLQLQ